MKVNIPSSQGGLNLKDSLDFMGPRYAIQMDNIIPDTNRDMVRGGCRKINSAPATRFLAFDGARQSALIIAGEGTLKVLENEELKDLGGGYASDNWQSVHFTDAGGRINLIAVNGVDSVRRFYFEDNGVLISEEAFSESSLYAPAVFKNRLYFAKGLDLFYGGVDAIGAGLKRFPLAAVFAQGGEIAAVADWTQDAGEGMDDLLVIVTTKGEAAVYRGLSPESEDWALTGLFKISKPIGRNCLIKYGGDLIVLTQGGYFPLSQVLAQDRANIAPISDKINPIVQGKDFTKAWGAWWYPRKGWIIINAPSSEQGLQYEQHVLNVKTGGWCRFLGWDALDFCVFRDDLYFCNQKGVFLADTGTTDDGERIPFYLQKAYTDLGVGGIKQVVQIKERSNALNNQYIANIIGVDFVLQDASPYFIKIANNSTYWDAGIWDKSLWTDESRVTQAKKAIFAKYGDFISVGILGLSATDLEFYSIAAKIKVGRGDVW